MHAQPRPERESRVVPSEAIAPPRPTPAVPAVPATAFHAVSEHDAAQGDEAAAHKPVRRRRQGEAAPQASLPLQMVETQPGVAAAPVAEAEEDSPRRPRRRRRSHGAAPAEPLQMVETQPGAETRGDSPAA